MKEYILKQHTKLRYHFIKNAAFWRQFMFPLLMMWLELSIHICDGGHIRYSIIYLAFALSLGFIFTAIGAFMKPRAFKIYAKISAFLLSLIYAAEFVAKTILQTMLCPPAVHRS